MNLLGVEPPEFHPSSWSRWEGLQNSPRTIGRREKQSLKMEFRPLKYFSVTSSPGVMTPFSFPPLFRLHPSFLKAQWLSWEQVGDDP